MTEATTAATDTIAGDRRNTLVAASILLCIAGLFLALLSWQGEVVGLVADDAVYLTLADYFSPYSSILRHGAAFVAQHGVFPPGFPLVLALSGASSQHVYYAHVVSTAIILGAYVCCARWLFLAGQKWLVTLSVVALLFLLPRAMLLHVDLLSEPLYLLLSMLALIKYETLGEQRDLRGVCLVAVCCAGAALTRSAGLALLVAFFVWQLVGAGRNRSWIPLLIAVGPVLGWAILKPIVYTQNRSYIADVLNNYSRFDPVALFGAVRQDFAYLWTGWRQYFDVSLNSSSLPAAILLPLAALPAFVQRLKRLRLDALYFAIYAGMVLLWPYPDHTSRLLYPLMPLVFFYVITSMGSLRESRWRAAFGTLIFGVTLLAAGPSTLRIIAKVFSNDAAVLGSFARTQAWLGSPSSLATIEENVWILRQLTTGFASSTRFIPERECVYATHHEMFMYYGRRYARPIAATDVSSKQLVNTPACRYLLVNWTSSQPYFRPGFPIADLPDLKFRVVYEQAGRRPQDPVGQERLVSQLVELSHNSP